MVERNSVQISFEGGMIDVRGEVATEAVQVKLLERGYNVG